MKSIHLKGTKLTTNPSLAGLSIGILQYIGSAPSGILSSIETFIKH